MASSPSAKVLPEAPGWRQTLLPDLSAGLVVFLVALPLCLGVALASNAPLFSGVLAGIVGGIVVGAISGSHVSVSGPAAGLTAVVAAQIAAVGSFEAFLLAVVIAGVLQIGLGIIRAGSLADFVPGSVIKGLLAAIGIILILKQLPHLLGHDKDPEGDMSFVQPDHETTFSELWDAVFNIHPGAMLIGLLGVGLLVAWDKSKFLKRLPMPGPLAAVLAGVAISLLLQHVGGPWVIEPNHLVQVPVANDLAGLFALLQLPDFSALGNAKVYSAAVTIAIVATLETLLNVEAVDKLDPQRRVTPSNRELIAQGVGNITAGLVGGLPVTSVIVRSSVAINSGGKTKLVTLVHGLLLAICVVLLPTWLNQIPLASLAAVLIVTGLKLAKPKLFVQMWREGWNQFLPFAVTVVAIVLTDLLIGILIGLGFSIVFILHSNLRRPMRRIVEHHLGGDVLHIELANQVSFLNRVALTRALDSAPRGGHLLIDARNTDYIDADVFDLIQEYVQETAPSRGVEVSLLGLREHYTQLEDRVQYVDYTTRELQAKLTPEAVLKILREGNDRFVSDQRLTRDFRRQRESMSKDGQHPLAVVFSSASSRTPVEMIFDAGLGELFCVRAIGHPVGTGALGNFEFACAVAGAKLIVVLGHSGSTAARLAIETFRTERLEPETSGAVHFERLVSELRKSVDPDRVKDWPNLTPAAHNACIDEVSRAHIARTIQKIYDGSSVITELAARNQVKLVGAMYDPRSGRVEFFE